MGYEQGRPRRTRSQCWRRSGSARRRGGRGSWRYTHRAVSGRPAGQGSAARVGEGRRWIGRERYWHYSGSRDRAACDCKGDFYDFPIGYRPERRYRIDDDYVDFSIGISNVVEERGGETERHSEANCIGKAAAVGVRRVKAHARLKIVDGKCHARHFCPVGVERNWNHRLPGRHGYILGYGQGRPRRTRSQCWRRSGCPGRQRNGEEDRTIASSAQQRSDPRVGERGGRGVGEPHLHSLTDESCTTSNPKSDLYQNPIGHRRQPPRPTYRRIHYDDIDLAVRVSNVVREHDPEFGEYGEANCIGKAIVVGVSQVEARTRFGIVDGKRHARYLPAIGVERNWNRRLSRHHGYPLGNGQGRTRWTRSRCWRRSWSARRRGGRGRSQCWRRSGCRGRQRNREEDRATASSAQQRSAPRVGERGRRGVGELHLHSLTDESCTTSNPKSDLYQNPIGHRRQPPRPTYRRIHYDDIDLAVRVSNVVREHDPEFGEYGEANCIGKAIVVGVSQVEARTRFGIVDGKRHPRYLPAVGVERYGNCRLPGRHGYILGYGQGRHRWARSRCWAWSSRQHGDFCRRWLSHRSADGSAQPWLAARIEEGRWRVVGEPHRGSRADRVCTAGDCKSDLNHNPIGQR